VDPKSSEIEILDAKRMRHLEIYILGVGVFIALSVTRYFFRLGGLNSQPIGVAVLVGLIISLGVISLSTILSAQFWNRVKYDPTMMDALNNELIQVLQLKSWKAAYLGAVGSWKAAYLGAVGTTLFFAVVTFFYPVSDPMLMALTSIIAGAGAYQATFYFLYRAS
jgi:hypothetical protein